MLALIDQTATVADADRRAVVRGARASRAHGRSARGLRGAAALAVLVVGLTSCAAPTPAPVDFSERTRGLAGRDYPRVHRRWTRYQKVRHGLDTAIEVWATMKSPEFREAFVERYAEVYALPAADKAALSASEREQAHKFYEFHISAQSGRFEWNDLDNDNSAWQLSLVDATGKILRPEAVSSPRIPDAFLAEFFPDRTAFTRTYLVRFAVPSRAEFAGAASGRLTLMIASPVGRAELVWSNR